MHDHFNKTIEIGDYIFGGIGYGNAIWIVTGEHSVEKILTNGAKAKLFRNRFKVHPLSETSVDINLDEFIKISDEDMTLYLLQFQV